MCMYIYIHVCVGVCDSPGGAICCSKVWLPKEKTGACQKWADPQAACTSLRLNWRQRVILLLPLFQTCAEPAPGALVSHWLLPSGPAGVAINLHQAGYGIAILLPVLHCCYFRPGETT